MNGVKYTGFVYRSILIYFRKKNRTNLGLASNFPRQKKKPVIKTNIVLSGTPAILMSSTSTHIHQRHENPYF